MPWDDPQAHHILWAKWLQQPKGNPLKKFLGQARSKSHRNWEMSPQRRKKKKKKGINEFLGIARIVSARRENTGSPRTTGGKMD